MSEMTEEWVSLWYQCLALNLDYSAYCDAKEQGKLKKCRDLERRFERIASIYDDFGTLDGWPDQGTSSPAWKEWFEPRRHLFISSATVIQSCVDYTPNAQSLLIAVPLQMDASSTVQLVVKLIAEHYKKNPVTATQHPKYRLHQKNERLAHGLQQVRKACISVARSYRYDLETAEELRHVDAVACFVRYEIDNMGWKLDPNAREELFDTGRLSEQRLDSFKAMLNRCRRDFQSFARNVIRNRFPDDTPFDSDVMDIF